MKRRWQTFVKDYLTFSLKERLGLLLLLMLIVGFYFAPTFFKKHRPPLQKEAFQQEIAQLKIYIDSSPAYARNRYKDDDDENNFYPSPSYNRNKEIEGELFTFDPNTLDAAGWKRLGVRDRTIETIMKFVGKGYTFKKPEDLKRIYGLKPAEAERLIPYVQIASTEKTTMPVAFTSNPNFTGRPPIASTPKNIDINEADTSALIALPGIGSKLAARIISFREKLGGFASVNQLAETYGLPDSTFQKIKNSLICKNPALKTININTADANILKAHPYLRWNLANAIIAYRQQHGLFKSVDDLKRIDIITEDIYTKVSPYLVVANK